MNVLVIPSWYPSDDFPVTGIFFKEQTLAMAKLFPEANFAISLWGSHERGLWLDAESWWKLPMRLVTKHTFKRRKNQLLPNCTEYFDPAFTWTMKIFSGNIGGIIAANFRNARAFQTDVGKIDLIHAHVGYPAGYIASQLSGLLGCPYIVTEHMGPFPFSSYLTSKGTLIALFAQAYKSASLVTAVSDALGEKMQDYGVGATVIQNFMDKPVVSSPSSPQKTVLFIGRLEPIKGVNELLLAIDDFLKMCPDFKVKIIGEGSLDRMVEGKSRSHPNSISHHKVLNRDEIWVEIAMSSFLVHAAHFEPFGVVLIEAMACGKPVVATRCGGPEEIVNEKVGLLARPKDAKDLAEKMLEMAKNLDKYDPEVIRGEFLAKFSSKVVGAKWMELYQQIVTGYKPK